MPTASSSLQLILQAAASLQPIRRAPCLILCGIRPGLHPSPAPALQSDLPKEDSDYECGLQSQTDPGSHPASSNDLGKSVNLSGLHFTSRMKKLPIFGGRQESIRRNSVGLTAELALSWLLTSPDSGILIGKMGILESILLVSMNLLGSF